MKLTKRVLSFLLTVVILASASSLNSFAAEEKVVTSADITFRTDIAGLDAVSYKDIISINSRGLDYDDEYYSVLHTYGTEWGPKYNGKFVSGTEYNFEIYLIAKDGYVLPETADEIELEFTGGTVTGSEVEYDDDDEYYYYCISFTATVTGKEIKIVDNIDITFRSDIAGLTYEDYRQIVQINSVGLGYDKEFYPVIYAYEYDEDMKEKPVTFKGKFVEGTTYSFYVYFVAKDGYDFPGQKQDISFQFGGCEVGDTMETTLFHDDFYQYRYYEIAFSATVESSNIFTRIINAVNAFFSQIIEFFSDMFDGLI